MRKPIDLLRLLSLPALLLALALLLWPDSSGEAQAGSVAVTPNREEVFVRIAPAIGHEVIGTLARGQIAYANGRSGNNEWLRIDYFGQEGWINTVVVDIAGNVAALPIGDPATLPLDYGNGARAGITSASGPASIRLPRSGLRLRAGPSTAYFFIANVPRYEVMSVLGRTSDSSWLQVNFRGTLGWVANQYIEVRGGSIEAAPVGGIVASGPLPSIPAEEVQPSAGRDALLTAMLLHLNVSVNRLDVVEGVWRAIAFGRYNCEFSDTMAHPQYYIPRGEDLQTYPELDSVIADLNQGLEEMGHAIEEWQLLCELYDQDYPVTNEVVRAGLEAVYNARAGFDRARQRIFALGLTPTPFIVPGFTPAAPIATATAPANAPDLEAFGLVDNRVTFVPQFVDTAAGCAWQGLGGQVFGLNQEPLVGFTVRVEGVTDPGFIFETVSGVDNTIFGPSGWLVRVGTQTNTFVYTVTLFQNGRRVSDPKRVSFPNDCNRNLGIMNFEQLTPLE